MLRQRRSNSKLLCNLPNNKSLGFCRTVEPLSKYYACLAQGHAVSHRKKVFSSHFNSLLTFTIYLELHYARGVVTFENDLIMS